MFRSQFCGLIAFGDSVRLLLTSISLAMLVAAAPSFAQDAAGVQSAKGSAVETQARKGWFWYIDPKEKEIKPKEESEPLVIQAKPTGAVEKIKEVVIGIGSKVEAAVESAFEDPCLKPATWSASCGFIDPGADFEFQSKQRDALLQQMSMRPDSPESVEAAQRYMKWVVAKASQAGNMWYFNLIQKPDLDPRVKSPISEMGIALASRVNSAAQVEYFRVMREQGGMLFYFSRNDCVFCHDQLPYSVRVARTMGLRLINVPLDGKCIEGFSEEDCAADVTVDEMSALDVQIVPTMYLFMPANTWLRLSTGITSDDTTLANAVNFFSAYRAALLQGIDNGDGVRPTVSFNPAYTGAVTGVSSASGEAAPNMPTQAKMMELMGMGQKLNATNAAVSAAGHAFTKAMAE